MSLHMVGVSWGTRLAIRMSVTATLCVSVHCILSGPECMAGQNGFLCSLYVAGASSQCVCIAFSNTGRDGQYLLLKCCICATVVLQTSCLSLLISAVHDLEVSFLSLLSSAVHDLEVAELLAAPAATQRASGSIRSAQYSLGWGGLHHFAFAFATFTTFLVIRLTLTVHCTWKRLEVRISSVLNQMNYNAGMHVSTSLSKRRAPCSERQQ